MSTRQPTQQELIDIYGRVLTIAVVGASRDPEKVAHQVPRYLHDLGYRIVPVSPRGGELFGERVYGSLSDVPGDVDLVQVFRPRDEALEVAASAVASGAPVLWFQPGTETEEAARAAAEAGMTVVTGLCMRATHERLGLGRVHEQRDAERVRDV